MNNQSYINSKAKPYHHMDGYYFIDNNERYVFNVEGEIFDLKMRRYKTWYTQKPAIYLDGRYRNIKRGYKITRLIQKNGAKKHVFQHRLIAWLKIPFEGDFENYVVNHIDGNGSNNSVNNLELCSYSENMKHAYGSGLCTNTRSVCMFDYLTQTEYNFTTVTECAGFLGVSDHYVYNKAKRNPGKVYDDRYSFKFSDSDIPWSGSKVKERKSGPYFGYNVLTQRMYITDTLDELSKLTKVSICQISAFIVGMVGYPIESFMFGEYNSELILPIFTSEQLELFKLDRKKPWQCGWIETDTEYNKERIVLQSDVMKERKLSMTHSYRTLKKGKSKCGRFLYRKVEPTAINHCPPPR